MANGIAIFGKPGGGGLASHLEQVLKTKGSSLKSWYVAATSEELAMVSKTAGFARVVTIEMLQNKELREAIAKLWLKHVWQPMVDGLDAMRAGGAIRKDVDIEVLARAMQCLHVGYFLARTVFAPDRKWDDAAEIEKMADLLAQGASNGSQRG